MKKEILLFSILVFSLFSKASAQDMDAVYKKMPFKKNKHLSRSYPVTSADMLTLENKAGNIEVRTWDRNEFKIDADVIVAAYTEEWANSVLSDLDIDEQKTVNSYSFTTLMAADMDKKEGGTKHYDKYNGKNTKQFQQINYVVYMPSANKLKAVNYFGDITLGDRTGETVIISNYGNLKTGSLSNLQKLDAEYAKCSFGKLNDVNINLKYSDAVFKELDGNVTLNIQYGDNIKINAGNSLKALNVNSTYAEINLVSSALMSGAYVFVTSYSSFVNRTNIKFSTADDKKRPKFDYTYSGKNGAGTVPVKISAAYGKIVFGKAAPEDMN